MLAEDDGRAACLCGGVIFGEGYQDQPDQNALNYLRGVYQELNNRGLAGGEYGAWPWTGVNIHVHRDTRSENQVNALFSSVKDIMVDYGDSGDLVVGEWGVTEEEQTPQYSAIGHLFNLIKPHASMMFFFKHGKYVEDGSTWGIHDWDVISGEYVVTDAPDGRELHGPLDELVGT